MNMGGWTMANEALGGQPRAKIRSFAAARHGARACLADPAALKRTSLD